MRIILYCILFNIFSTIVFSQSNSFNKNYFQYPLNIPIKLNANFGEMRPNHFHMGLDLFTERRENLPVLAAADGYIARIKNEPSGFGRALYINHPNGLTTLYAHMNTFIPAIEAYLKKEQYTQEKWQIEAVLPIDAIPVKKGQLIGYSGNTGASQGPHVHFEIRQTLNDACINPLHFNFGLNDVTAPTVFKVAIYNRELASTYDAMPLSIPLKKVNDTFTTKEKIIALNYSKISFAILAEDKITGFANNYGIYEAIVYHNNQFTSSFKIDSIGYNNTRYLNGHIDYRIKTNGGAYWQHTAPLPGMKLSMYKKNIENGVIDLSDGKVHEVMIEVKDADGNSSLVKLLLQKKSTTDKSAGAYSKNYLLPNQVNIFEQEEMQAYLSENALYDAAKILYNAEKTGGTSSVHYFMSPSIPLHDSMRVGIKANAQITEKYKDKIVMQQSGKRTALKKAMYSQGWYYASFREFGKFQLLVDTIKPTLSGLDEFEVNDISRMEKIRLVVNDNYGVIKNFRAELDNKWLMFANYGNVFIYTMDDHCPIGKYQLKVSAEDEAGNKIVKNFLLVKKDPKDLPPLKPKAKSKSSKKKKSAAKTNKKRKK